MLKSKKLMSKNSGHQELHAATPGIPMPQPFRQAVEAKTGQDLSNTVLHANSSKARELGLKGFSQGGHVHLNGTPHSQQGQDIVKHELHHEIMDRTADGSKPNSARMEQEANRPDGPQIRGSFTRNKAPADGPIRPYLDHYKPTALDAMGYPIDPANQFKVNTAHDEAVKIDKDVEDAHKHVQKVVDDVIAGRQSVTNIAAQFPYSTHAADFQNKMLDFLGKHQSVHPSVSGGYVIEDYATVEAKKRGVVDTQKVPHDLGGSRPDFMIPLDGTGTDFGLLDATADKSAGHILGKSGNWTGHKHYPYVAETLYPSLDFTGAGGAPLSPADLAAIKTRWQKKADAEKKKESDEKVLLKQQSDEILVELNSGRHGNIHQLILGRLSTIFGPAQFSIDSGSGMMVHDFDEWFLKVMDGDRALIRGLDALAVKFKLKKYDQRRSAVYKK